MDVPADLFYLPTHEWVRLDGTTATVGITDFAQHELGDIVFIELPEVGQAVEANVPFGSVESIKAAEDLHSPLTGEVIAVHEGIADEGALVNDDPYGEGWLLQLRVAEGVETSHLLNPVAYAELLDSEAS